MSGKMKFALVVLAFMTPVSLSLLFSGLQQPDSSPVSARIATQYRPQTGLDDEDGDGLSNRDEELWQTDWRNPDTDNDGFKDGEEVLSGHDPTKPGPNDFLDPTKNVTRRFSTLLTGGILSGDITPGDPDSVIYVNEISDTVVEEYQRFTLTPRLVELELVENSSTSVAEYISAMLPHWHTTFVESLESVESYLGHFGSADRTRTEALLNDEGRYTQMLLESSRLSSELESAAQTLQDVPVPEAMENAHRNAVLLLRAFAQQVERSSQHKEDPAAAKLATTALASLTTRTAFAFLQDYFQSLNFAIEAHINTPIRELLDSNE